MSDAAALDALALGREIEAGRSDPRDLTQRYLDAAKRQDPDARIFVRLTETRALAEAEAAAERAARGLRRSPLDGVPVSWKDNFDTAGIATEAGSKMLAGRIPGRDAAALARATRAGLICLGKTNMTELAFSGLGYNPYTGTPHNPFDSATPRLPGGSSAGAAVALARGLCAASIGTDTGGSVRIPAAWNGLVGFKPTAGRIPKEGVVPLSPLYDTVGPLTRSVADAAAFYSLLAADTPIDLTGTAGAPLHLLAAEGPLLGQMAGDVGAAYEAALARLGQGPGRVTRTAAPALTEAAAWGGVPIAPEAHALWWDSIERHPGCVFERITERIALGAGLSAAKLEAQRQALHRLARQFSAETAGFDALLLPTVAIAAPAIAEVEASAEAYYRINGLALSLTSLVNALGLCAISLPVAPAAAGALPVGLMLVGRAGADRHLLRTAAATEARLTAEF